MPETTAAVRSALSWFEIPTRDLDRARRFYETMLDTALDVHPFGSARIAVFPYTRPGVGGCLDEGSSARPSDEGTVIYLDAGERLDAALAAVEPAGGKVILGRTALPPGMGFFAHVVDTEGNRIGLHAMV